MAPGYATAVLSRDARQKLLFGSDFQLDRQPGCLSIVSVTIPAANWAVTAAADYAAESVTQLVRKGLSNMAPTGWMALAGTGDAGGKRIFE
jgi:hypothetical protein